MDSYCVEAKTLSGLHGFYSTARLYPPLIVSTTQCQLSQHFPNQCQLGPRRKCQCPKPNFNPGPSAFYPTVNVLTGQYPPPTVIPTGPRKKIGGIEAVAVCRIEVACCYHCKMEIAKEQGFQISK